MGNRRINHVMAAGDVILRPTEQVRLASRIDALSEARLPPLDPVTLLLVAGTAYLAHRRTRDLPKRPKHTLVDDISFKTRPTLVTTNERVLIISTTVRARRSKILYEWPHSMARVTAINERFGDRYIQLFLSDGWGRNFTRHDGSKLSEWETASVDPEIPVLVQ